jgi:hypothetical protein
LRQLVEHGNRRFGTDQNALGWAARADDDKNGAWPELARAQPLSRFDDLVASEKLGYFGRLGGDEAQAVQAVALQEPADGAIAKAAMAIEYDQQAVADLG